MPKEFTLSQSDYEEALLKSAKRPRSPWQLDAVVYDKARKSIVLIFPERFGFSIPIHHVDELATAKIKDIEKIFLTPSGETLVVEGVDAYISAKGLIEDMLKSIPRGILTSNFASIGGAKTSANKRSSSIENGRKGGRPKMHTRLEQLEAA
jgi:hypothetical protein